MAKKAQKAQKAQMRAAERLDAAHVPLPMHLDILVHLGVPEDEPGHVFLGTVLQYNVSAVGEDVRSAATNALELAIQHGKAAREMGVAPKSTANLYYTAAFVMGTPIPGFSAEGVDARIKRDLAIQLGYPYEVSARNVCHLQARYNSFDIEDLVKLAG